MASPGPVAESPMLQSTASLGPMWGPEAGFGADVDVEDGDPGDGPPSLSPRRAVMHPPRSTGDGSGGATTKPSAKRGEGPVAMPGLTFPARARAPVDDAADGSMTPHADAHVRGTNPVAARVAMPDYRAPVGFANHSWNFASGLPTALRSPPGHLAAVTPNRRWEGGPPKFVPMEAQPKPSRAAQKPPPPLSARQSFTRWGFTAGTYVSDHQPQPQYLGLKVRGLSGHHLVPQSEAETEAAAFAESRHEIMAGVMAANQMYTEMLLAQDDAPVIESMARVIEQDEAAAAASAAASAPSQQQQRMVAVTPTAARTAFDTFTSVEDGTPDFLMYPNNKPATPAAAAHVEAPAPTPPQDSDAAAPASDGEGDGDDADVNVEATDASGQGAGAGNEGAGAGNERTGAGNEGDGPGAVDTKAEEEPSTQEGAPGDAGEESAKPVFVDVPAKRSSRARARWRRASVKIRVARLFTRDNMLQRAIEEAHAAALREADKAVASCLPTQAEQAAQLQEKRQTLTTKASKRKFMSASRVARQLWRVVTKIVRSVGHDALLNPAGGNFAYVSTILIAKNKAAQLDRVMEERERVLEAAQNGAVDADLELYSLENVKKRASLSHHPSVVSRIFKLWYIANPMALLWAQDNGGIPEPGQRVATAFLLQNATAQPAMTADQYYQLYVRCIRALAPDMSPEDVDETIKDDWTEDAQGRTELEFKRFHMSLFQLTDMWCEGIDEGEYVTFLENLLGAIAYQNEDGTWVFRDLDDIEPLYPVKKKKTKKKKGGNTSRNTSRNSAKSGGRGSSRSPIRRGNQRNANSDPLKTAADKAAGQLATLVRRVQATEEGGDGWSPGESPIKTGRSGSPNLTPIGDSFYGRLTRNRYLTDEEKKFYGLLVLEHPDTTSAYHGAGSLVQPGIGMTRTAGPEGAPGWTVQRPRNAANNVSSRVRPRSAANRPRSAAMQRGGSTRARPSTASATRRGNRIPHVIQQHAANREEATPDGGGDAGTATPDHDDVRRRSHAAKFGTFQAVRPAGSPAVSAPVDAASPVPLAAEQGVAPSMTQATSSRRVQQVRSVVAAAQPSPRQRTLFSEGATAMAPLRRRKSRNNSALNALVVQGSNATSPPPMASPIRVGMTRIDRRGHAASTSALPQHQAGSTRRVMANSASAAQVGRRPKSAAVGRRNIVRRKQARMQRDGSRRRGTGGSDRWAAPPSVVGTGGRPVTAPTGSAARGGVSRQGSTSTRSQQQRSHGATGPASGSPPREQPPTTTQVQSPDQDASDGVRVPTVQRTSDGRATDSPPAVVHGDAQPAELTLHSAFEEMAVAIGAWDTSQPSHSPRVRTGRGPGPGRGRVPANVRLDVAPQGVRMVVPASRNPANPIATSPMMLDARRRRRSSLESLEVVGLGGGWGTTSQTVKAQLAETQGSRGQRRTSNPTAIGAAQRQGSRSRLHPGGPSVLAQQRSRRRLSTARRQVRTVPNRGLVTTSNGQTVPGSRARRRASRR